MIKANQEIRRAIKEAGVMSYSVSEKLGIHESTFYRILRKEFSDAKKREVLKIIAELKGEFAVPNTDK